MMNPFTLNYLETHTYEEVENRGKQLGLWHDASPGRGEIKTLFGYSRALTVFRSRMMGSFSLISN